MFLPFISPNGRSALFGRCLSTFSLNVHGAIWMWCWSHVGKQIMMRRALATGKVGGGEKGFLVLEDKAIQG